MTLPRFMSVYLDRRWERSRGTEGRCVSSMLEVYWENATDDVYVEAGLMQISSFENFTMEWAATYFGEDTTGPVRVAPR